uniref:SCP domain-containing protein n=1 Tax=Chromera velia CCMP2878 TaxID=1169474 RepID=A0A0G4HIU0_9ALVE|mmetsp:Transcript_42944/g.84688  ORF Transcript_42944/g.84688 Transcript_42944/m.84688 type:complete len:622 (+) Transcript_42944:260-2125(+)|eukprot:Cvel_28053.t1-p1 / transcript=Cvel_28053.t1 / gene=Cvel_28053 / organism=Chromera_velia_CCMP2878 / gene_product=Protein PRY1, putative / transcript_product=Protein PRY1, putative / location=Cvel_scaffold3605:8112-14660(-) / protein_length=621 / sequence_SO=supercontig / SO=protein_coding / is_pseudo=false
MTKSLLLVFLSVCFASGVRAEPEDPHVAAQLRQLANDNTRLSFIVRHNYYRCLHDTPMLKWNYCMEDSAQTWADRGVFKHSASYSLTGCAGPAGENLAIGYSTPERGIDAYYSEKSIWEASSMDKFISGAGHYTAMLWTRATELGCARQSGGRMDVCRYTGDTRRGCDLPNMGGCYTSNVKPRDNTKTEAACLAQAQAWGLGGTTTTTTTTTAAPSPGSGSDSASGSGSGSDGTSSSDDATTSTTPRPRFAQSLPAGGNEGVQIGENGQAELPADWVDIGEQLETPEEKRDFVRETVERILEIMEQEGQQDGDNSDGSTILDVSELPFPDEVKERIQSVKVFPSGSKIEIDEETLDLEKGLYCPLSNDGDSFTVVRNDQELKVTRAGGAFVVEIDGEVVGGYAKAGDSVPAEAISLTVVLGSATIMFEKLDILEWWVIFLIVLACVIFAAGLGLALFCLWRRWKKKREGQKEEQTAEEITNRKKLQNIFAFAKGRGGAKNPPEGSEGDVEWGSGSAFGDGDADAVADEREGSGDTPTGSAEHKKKTAGSKASSGWKWPWSRKNERKNTNESSVATAPPAGTLPFAPPGASTQPQASPAATTTPASLPKPTPNPVALQVSAF